MASQGNDHDIQDRDDDGRRRGKGSASGCLIPSDGGEVFTCLCAIWPHTGRQHSKSLLQCSTIVIKCACVAASPKCPGFSRHACEVTSDIPWSLIQTVHMGDASSNRTNLFGLGRGRVGTPYLVVRYRRAYDDVLAIADPGSNKDAAV